MPNESHAHVFYSSATSGYMTKYERCDGCTTVRIFLFRNNSGTKTDWYYYKVGDNE